MPMADLTSEGVKNFFDAETSLFGSFIKAPKERPRRVGQRKGRATRRQKEVAV